MKKKLIAPAAVALAAAFLLSGCGPDAGRGSQPSRNVGGNNVYVVELDRPGGGVVECAVASGTGTGIDCDWGGMKP